MIGITEANQLISQHVPAAEKTTFPLPLSLGCVLSKDVVSDIDSPPYDKALMDGYAVVASDLSSGAAELKVVEEVHAGSTPRHVLVPGNATRIMTGAPIPRGADAVVRVEDTESLDADGGRVRVDQSPVTAGQFIMKQASVMGRGQIVLRAGKVLRPIEIGVLAEVGRDQVDVYQRPSVAVIPTGDELVPVTSSPAPGQIRNSNGPMIASLIARHGGVPVDLGIGPDDKQQLTALVRHGLTSDVLILSGGVSAGTKDLVPAVLQEVGVKMVFHKVNIKPGKPVWFGTRAYKARTTLVFGLPGNPVSSLVCFLVFVAPVLRWLSGRRETHATNLASLDSEHSIQGDRPTYWPVKLNCQGGVNSARPLRWLGSPDMKTISEADGLAFFPTGNRTYRAGEAVDVLLLR